MSKFFYLILFMVSPEVFAGPFDPPPTDRSIELLGTIFGSNIGNIYLGGAPNPVLGNMIEAFNFIIVIVGTFLVSYVGIISTINTAQEGTAMGRKWSAVWIPMRSVAGMLLLVPSPASGYSMIQVTVMWIITQGIGAADEVWNIALDGLAKGSSVMTGSSEGGGNPGVTRQFRNQGIKLARDILNASICMESLHRAASNDEYLPDSNIVKHGENIKHYVVTNGLTSAPTGNNDDSIFSGVSYFGVNRNDLTPDLSAVCGSIAVEGVATKGDEEDVSSRDKAAQTIYYKKQEVISTMLSTLRPLAKGILDGDIKPLGDPANSELLKRNQKGDYDPPGYIDAAGELYVSMLSSLNKVVALDAIIEQQIRQGKQFGWIMAGTYYFIFATSPSTELYEKAFDEVTSNSILESFTKVDVATIYNNPSDESLVVASELLDQKSDDAANMRKAIAQGSVYWEKDKAPSSRPFNLGFSEGGAGNEALTEVTSTTSAMMNQMRVWMEKDNIDPIRGHAKFGKELMIAAETMWFTVMAIAVAGAIGAAFSFSFIFMSINLWVPYFMLMSFVVAVVLPIAMILFTIGATLAVYTPMIPYIIFTVTVLGWVLVVVEAIIAAPIIALGFVTPSGDELGKITHGLTLLANIFLRPMLMIFGFLLAGRVYKAIIDLVHFGILEVFDTLKGTESIFSPVVAMIVYAAFIISLVNKCFSLIYAVPDKILRWIGGPSESTDVSQELGATKGGTQAAAKHVGGAAGGMARLGAKGSMAQAKKAAEKSQKPE